MITRYALFEGRVHDGQNEAFREAVLSEILPKWKSFPGATAVCVTFAGSRDGGFSGRMHHHVTAAPAHEPA